MPDGAGGTSREEGRRQRRLCRRVWGRNKGQQPGASRQRSTARPYGQVRRKNAYDRDIILIGDMNVPKMRETDKVYQQLTRFGYEPTEHPSRVGATTREGTNLPGTKHYDQIATSPKRTRRPTDSGILNFDRYLLRRIWNRHNLRPDSDDDLEVWGRYCESHLSDHRPLWASFNI